MLLSAFIFGLLGSFHCVGMCGPIAFVLPVDRHSNSKKFVQIFIYHFGRILAYAIIGLLFGLLGKGLYLFGMQQQLSVAVGILMILAILLPQRSFNKYNFSKPVYRIISKVKNRLGKELKKKTPDTFLSVGFLNGFLPCGLVYMAVFGALASGNAFQGSLYMVLFGAGTIPLMTTAIYLGNFVSGKVRIKIRKSIPYFVVLIGLLFILRGMGIGIPYISPKPVQQEISANYSCHK
ncbi:sulfite exporter TauE/SafE family protein [Salegentibacter chungangensis]|uniref:Sulfite exporter TauE/SafE family protein n=1 Tax=Salegentibacter chungangensis TaxID=1335724 RepID=A0ABW3NSR9_9FLAO